MLHVLWIQIMAMNVFLFWEAAVCMTPDSDEVTGSNPGVVYGDPAKYSIALVKNVTVKEGQCITIPCNFTADRRTKFTSSAGIWRNASESNVAFSNKSQAAKPNFKVIGNSDSGNCTLTITKAVKEDSGLYHFRFENKNEPKKSYSFINNAVNVSVIDCKEVTPSDCTPPSREAVSYWIIGITCGIILIIIIAIVLLFKFYSRQQTSKSDIECSQQIPSSQDIPPDDVSHLYAKVQKAKSKENCPPAEEEVKYSSVKFSKGVATNKANQSDTEYSEIKFP